jgi:hypothetical protein
MPYDHRLAVCPSESWLYRPTSFFRSSPRLNGPRLNYLRNHQGERSIVRFKSVEIVSRSGVEWRPSAGRSLCRWFYRWRR